MLVQSNALADEREALKQQVTAREAELVEQAGAAIAQQRSFLAAAAAAVEAATVASTDAADEALRSEGVAVVESVLREANATLSQPLTQSVAQVEESGAPLAACYRATGISY